MSDFLNGAKNRTSFNQSGNSTYPRAAGTEQLVGPAGTFLGTAFLEGAVGVFLLLSWDR
jgi:hypothetical protein